MDNLQNFVYRGQRPNPMPQPSPKRVVTPGRSQLDTILESSNAQRGGPQTQFPHQSQLTQLNPERSRAHGLPPLHNEEKRPPSYATQDGQGLDPQWPLHAGVDAAREEPEKPSRVRRVLDRRGGWKRLALIILIPLVLIIIALGVGLGVGLHKDSSNNNNTSDSGSNPNTGSPTSQTNPQGPFPIGAYAISAFLTSISTSCTSDPATWSCYPYTLYTTSATDSEAPFNWIIRQDPSSSSADASATQYLASSAQNPLAITFTNRSLTLEDEGTDQERYTFTVPSLLKNVIPNQAIGGSDSLTSCFYNSTTLRASLYTRMNATLVDSNGQAPTGMRSAATEGGGSPSFNEPWPYAVRIEQVVEGGEDVPNCYILRNGRVTGERVEVPTEGPGTQCSCLYMNYGDGSGGS